MAKWVNLDDCVEISIGDMNFYPVELLGDVYEEVTPVVHAHWEPSILPILQVDWFRCSHCKVDAIQTPFDIPAKTEICPNCGAKMDEEVEDA